ncbi:MAG: universal stress protein [Syntrophomonadaceae bacterium]|jgi:nucleotide-binding universal stress UspA family protein
MIKRILVAYDDGMVAAKALNTAVELAKSTSAEIYLVSVFSPADLNSFSTETYNPKLAQAFNEQSRAHLEKVQTEAVRKVKEDGVNLHTRIEEGKPGEVISQIAEELKVDLIVMGSHNRGALGRFLMGSVSNYVLQNTYIPVLIVKG